MRELEDGVSILKYDINAIAANGFNGTTNTIFTCPDCASNNGTKANPVLTGDLFGDWREEVIWRTANNLSLRIYTTTIPATNRLYTFLQDAQYRLALVWQNVAYNQPPWPSFYVGPGMGPQPEVDMQHPVVIAGSIASKAGPAAARVWTLEVRSTGTAPAKATQIQGLTLVQTSGAACTPTVLAPAQFPIELGDIAAGASALANVTIDLSSCEAAARFAVEAPLSAMDGAATNILSRPNELR